MEDVRRPCLYKAAWCPGWPGPTLRRQVRASEAPSYPHECPRRRHEPSRSMWASADRREKFSKHCLQCVTAPAWSKEGEGDGKRRAVPRADVEGGKEGQELLTAVFLLTWQGGWPSETSSSRLCGPWSRRGLLAASFGERMPCFSLPRRAEREEEEEEEEDHHVVGG
ncbi:unnamed protein product [Prorocentrum cordatum]|uniref:Uncharacterized protein n=1 Tax=Prorocentrum cordatum TaxID=2364126 RepID=A0ABN9R5N1_9DINO|nr:unnamed protein product [Polarella glacialis]